MWSRRSLCDMFREFYNNIKYDPQPQHNLDFWCSGRDIIRRNQIYGSANSRQWKARKHTVGQSWCHNVSHLHWIHRIRQTLQDTLEDAKNQCMFISCQTLSILSTCSSKRTNAYTRLKATHRLKVYIPKPHAVCKR